MNTEKKFLKILYSAVSAAVIFGAICALGSCTGTAPATDESGYSSNASLGSSASSVSTAASSGAENTASTAKSAAAEYKMSTFTESENAQSSVKIDYPVFSGDKAEKINEAIMSTVKKLARLEGDYYEEETEYTVQFKSQVTLNNGKAISVVFWGDTYVKGSAHPFTEIKALNMDSETAQEISLSQMYKTDEGFRKVFFEKAFFPDDPITSYDKDSFAEMLAMQSPEYQTVSPFDIDGGVSFYLTDDAIVLSMSAVHATGSDHFEGGLKYSDITQYRNPAGAAYIG